MLPKLVLGGSDVAETNIVLGLTSACLHSEAPAYLWLLAELTVGRRVVGRIHLLRRAVFLKSKNSISHLERDNSCLHGVCTEIIDSFTGLTLQKQLNAV